MPSAYWLGLHDHERGVKVQVLYSVIVSRGKVRDV
jgi:hypothetical protein